MAPRLRSAVVRFDTLPEPVLRILFLALPVDARARAACVCRGWRAFLSDVSLWQVLDLRPAGGVAAERVTENLVRGTVARAAGGLRSLSLNRVRYVDLHGVLLELLQSDGAELQQVTTDMPLTVLALRAVFAAAPKLQALNAQVSGQCMALLPFLRNDPPYGPLRVSELDLFGIEGEAVALALAAAVAAHGSLTSLRLEALNVARWLNALVDAAAERRISALSITRCSLDAETLPALARLLRRGSLSKLKVTCTGFPNAHEESVTELCTAIRACPTLTHLELFWTPPHGPNRRTVTELLDAAAALPALSVLDVRRSAVQDNAAAGRAFGAFLRADLPSLRTLVVIGCDLGDEGMAALLDGLAANTHLRELHCRLNNESEAFYRDRLVPALAALEARAALDA